MKPLRTYAVWGLLVLVPGRPLSFAPTSCYRDGEIGPPPPLAKPSCPSRARASLRP